MARKKINGMKLALTGQNIPLLESCVEPAFPLPSGERVRVRGRCKPWLPSPHSSPIKGEEVHSLIVAEKYTNVSVLLPSPAASRRCCQEQKNAGSGLVWSLILAVALVVSLPSMVQAQLETVKLGDLSAISNAPIYIAIEKGFFKEQGIRTDITNFASAAKMVPALVAGELEVSVGSASAGLFNAVAQQAPFRIVADKGQTREGYGFSLLCVRKDLVESGQVKSVRDLKGKKIAILAKGNIQHYLVGKMLEEVGLTINDVEMTNLDAPNQVTAFETKAIDAAYAVEPWPARFQERGVAVHFRTPDQVKGLGPVQIGVITYSGKFIKERRAVAQRWMNGYLKGAELFHRNGAKDPEIAAILEKYTKVPANVIKAAIPVYQDPTGRPLMENLADQAQWFFKNGYMEKRVSIESAVDLSFLK